jgi:DNA-binding cell septation regulator SpoVG
VNKKIVIICAALIFVVVITGGFIININRDAANASEISRDKENVSDDKIEQMVSGYSFETTQKNVINKEFDGTYLDSFITVALEQEEFLVNIKGIDSNSKVFIINPDSGETIPVEYKDGEFSVSVKLDKDVNYGIIIDYSLLGAIRIVEDLNTINNEQLVKEMLMSMGCGL